MNHRKEYQEGHRKVLKEKERQTCRQVDFAHHQSYLLQESQELDLVLYNFFFHTGHEY